MKKTLAMAALALAVSMSAHAVRAIHKLFPMKQNDGTTVMLYKNGDGYLAYYTTPDDQVVVPDEKGALYYAVVKDGRLSASSILVHDIADRTEREKAFVLQNTLKPADAAEIEYNRTDSPARRSISRAIGSSSTDGLGTYGKSGLGAIPSVGKRNIPVIMVEFSDVKFQASMTKEKYSRFLNAEGYAEDSPYQVGSVRDYFLAQSRGMFDPTFDVVAKVTLPNSYKKYGANGAGGGHDVGVLTMVKEAIRDAINQGVDFSKYEEKYKIPNVIVLYAGYGEATSSDPNTIWPHERDLGTQTGAIGEYIFGSYFVGNELNGSYGNQVMGMGVMVHELGHALGLPDFYDPTYSYRNDAPMGKWSVMDSGPYVRDSYAPIGYSAYERSYMGWLKIPELTDAAAVSLSDVNDAEGDFAVLYRNPSNANEYYIMENRQTGTWYPEEFGTGLLVTRFSYDRAKWSTNAANVIQSKKRAMVVTAGGRALNNDAKPADLFGNGVNNITSFNWLEGGSTTDAPIYKILKSSDGVITFNFKDRSLAAAYAADNGEAYVRVDDAGTLAAEDKVILVNAEDGVAMSVDAQGDNRGVSAVKVLGDNVLSNDNIIVFKLLQTASGKWGFISDANYLSMSKTGLKLVKKADANCMTDITIADGNASVVFSGTATPRYLSYDKDAVVFSSFTASKDNFQIYRKTDALSINGVTTTGVKKDGRVFNLAGQQVGDDYKGIVIVNGKKIVRK